MAIVIVGLKMTHHNIIIFDIKESHQRKEFGCCGRKTTATKTTTNIALFHHNIDK